MLALPITSIDGDKDALVVIIDEVAVERMRNGDPVMIAMKGVKEDYPQLQLVFCLEADHEKITTDLQTKDIGDVLEYLTRGFEYRPDLGDTDDPPKKVEIERS